MVLLPADQVKEHPHDKRLLDRATAVLQKALALTPARADLQVRREAQLRCRQPAAGCRPGMG